MDSASDRPFCMILLAIGFCIGMVLGPVLMVSVTDRVNISLHVLTLCTICAAILLTAWEVLA